MTQAKERTIQAMSSIMDIMVESIAIAGDAGVPSGFLYTALTSSGMTITLYTILIDSLVAQGRITNHHHLLKAASQKEEVGHVL